MDQTYLVEEQDEDSETFSDGYCDGFCTNYICLFQDIIKDLPPAPNTYSASCEKFLLDEQELDDVSWCSRNAINLAYILGIKANKISDFVKKDEEYGDGNGCVLCQACDSEMTVNKAKRILCLTQLMETE